MLLGLFAQIDMTAYQDRESVQSFTGSSVGYQGESPMRKVISLFPTINYLLYLFSVVSGRAIGCDSPTLLAICMAVYHLGYMYLFLFCVDNQSKCRWLALLYRFSPMLPMLWCFWTNSRKVTVKASLHYY